MAMMAEDRLIRRIGIGVCVACAIAIGLLIFIGVWFAPAHAQSGWTVYQAGQYPQRIERDSVNGSGYVVTQPGQMPAYVRPSPYERDQFYGGIVPGYRDERSR